MGSEWSGPSKVTTDGPIVGELRTVAHTHRQEARDSMWIKNENENEIVGPSLVRLKVERPLRERDPGIFEWRDTGSCRRYVVRRVSPCKGTLRSILIR